MENECQSSCHKDILTHFIGLIGEQKCYIQIGLMLSQAGVKYQLVLYGSICLKMVNSKSLKFF